MSPVVIAVIVITLLGLAFGLILSVAGKKLAVEVDPRIEQILALLPGANCGGCGHAGCASMADAIVNGQEADASKCAACAEDNKKAIAAVMGKAAADGPKVRMIPRLHCNGCTANREKVSNYQGIHNCYVAAKTLGGLVMALVLMPAPSVHSPSVIKVFLLSTMTNALVAAIALKLALNYFWKWLIPLRRYSYNAITVKKASLP